MKEITFDTLPQAVFKLIEEVSELKQLLLSKENLGKTACDRWFDMNELCAYHPDKPAKPTVYGWVNLGLIPVHKNGKKLRFLKSEIDNWLKQGKKKSTSDINAEANNYLTRKQK